MHAPMKQGRFYLHQFYLSFLSLMNESMCLCVYVHIKHTQKICMTKDYWAGKTVTWVGKGNQSVNEEKENKGLIGFIGFTLTFHDTCFNTFIILV